MTQQGTEEWKLERVGKVTASRVFDIIEQTKAGKPTAKRETYAFDLATEIITNRPIEFFENSYMRWGTDNEPIARAKYQERSFAQIVEVGFITHHSISRSGCSPDGVTEDGDGLIEIKCLQSKNHIASMLANEVPENYLTQMLWQLACMPERVWNDFVCFDPIMPEKGQLFIKRVHRKDYAEKISWLEDQVKSFLDNDVMNIVNKINRVMEKNG